MKNKTVLITGGTGFLGQGLVKHLLKTDIKRIRVFSRSEHKQLAMAKEYKDPRIDYLLGDIRDYRRLRLAMKDADTVIHAAALKCIEKGQSDPAEFFKTNAIGALNIVDCALELNTPKIIGVSTDKACGDVSNLYGATKLNADMLFQAANNYNKDGYPQFVVVRYGNVINSTGSVLPLWRKQKAEKQAMTITDPEMTRFLITRQQAVDFIMDVIEHGKPGEILVPQLKACYIRDLAKAFDPDGNYKIIGKRPGERMYEILVGTNDEIHSDECQHLTVEEIKELIWNSEM